VAFVRCPPAPTAGAVVVVVGIFYWNVLGVTYFTEDERRAGPTQILTSVACFVGTFRKYPKRYMMGVCLLLFHNCILTQPPATINHDLSCRSWTVWGGTWERGLRYVRRNGFGRKSRRGRGVLKRSRVSVIFIFGHSPRWIHHGNYRGYPRVTVVLNESLSVVATMVLCGIDRNISVLQAYSCSRWPATGWCCACSSSAPVRERGTRRRHWAEDPRVLARPAWRSAW